LTPSEADLQIASLLGADNIAFYIVDNRVERLYAVVEPTPEKVCEPLPESLVDDYFRPGGALAGVLPGFEFRAEQAELARAVVRAFNRPGFLLAEAGTRVGKSLAYLIPAALWAQRNQARVVISTNTINLQEQLVNKDLPLLIEHLRLPLKIALIKGRGNYLCRRRAAELRAELDEDEARFAELLPEESDGELEALLRWAAATQDGSRADLPGLPSPAVWELVASDADACLVSRCPFFGACFFYRARRAAAAAQVLIVNHHLVMADLQFPSQFGVLPEYEVLVLDEVHHLEDVATGHLGESLSRIGMLQQLARLAHPRRPSLGLLRRLRRKLSAGPPGTPEPPPFWSELAALAEGEVEPAVFILREILGSLFGDLQQQLADAFVAPDDLGEEGAFRLRITDKERQHEVWKGAVAGLVGELLQEIERVVSVLGGLVGKIDVGIEEKLLPEDFFSAWQSEAVAALDRLKAQADLLRRFFLTEQSQPELIAWIEVSGGRRRNLKLMLAPLEVASLLEKMLYQRLKTLIMVSATVAVERRFDYFVGRTGLQPRLAEGGLETLILQSPFDYRNNVLVMVPIDLPPPTQSDFIAALALFLDTLLARVGGRSLVLFTSYRAMRQAASICRDSLQRRGLRLLLQGEGQRPWLLGELKNNFNTILFATDSFWEGVDVKGRALECLVIVRLPFRVPSDPVQVARLEYVAACGGNPFYDYSLPQTALKLKQGVGRLIRSRSDRGIIVICDRRLATSRYGGRLRSVLPPGELIVRPGGELISRAARFFAQNPAPAHPAVSEP
jgi:ATP-dependent DNA helicase DinG